MGPRSTPWALLHGFAGGPSSWDRVLEGVADHPGIRPRILGHGALMEAQSFWEEVDRLAAEIAATSPGPAHLVGYSMGGRLAYGLLLRHPSRFSSATIVGAHPGLGDPTEREARRRWERRWERLLLDRGIERFVETWEAQPIFESQRALSPERREVQRRLRLSHDPASLARAMRTLGTGQMPDLRPALATLERPLTLVAGALDTKYARLLGELAEEIPGARLRLLPGVGHNVPLEAPARLREIISVASLGGAEP